MMWGSVDVEIQADEMMIPEGWTLSQEVAKRGEDNLEEIKKIRPYLAEHWDRFVVFSVPCDIGAVSSSSFWEKLYNHDDTAREMVTEAVWELLDRNGKIPWNAITDFREAGHEFLSNFYE